MTEPIWSTGGAGGDHAVTADLEWAVGALRAAADAVARARSELIGHSAWVADPSHAELAESLRRGAALAATLEDSLDDTARRLATVTTGYLDAEHAARHSVGLAERAGQIFHDVVSFAPWASQVAIALAVAGATPFGPRAALAVVPHSPPRTTGLIDRDAVEAAFSVPGLSALAAAMDAIMLSSPYRAIVDWNGRLTTRRVFPCTARSVEDVMDRLADVEAIWGGAVRIERWTGEDGVTRRVVFIPGTKDWGNFTNNPFDMEADIALMAGRLPDAAAVVAAALAADGAQPGDPVMLTGHSLGGIVATALAGNEAMQRRFTISAVLTAGSPTGRITLPASVNALHLEGTRDIVPGLDGRPNPDTATRVTVHHDVRDSELAALEGEGEDIGSAHSLDSYRQTARLVDDGLDASTDAWLTAEGDFLNPTGEVVVTEYRP
jgi:hypothetical protein